MPLQRKIFWAKNLFESTITPPADLTIADTVCKYHVLQMRPQFPQFTDYLDMDIQQAINVKSFGLFCNFADGLLFKQPSSVLSTELVVSPLNTLTPTKLTGTLTGTFHNKAVVGTGTLFTTEVVAGDILRIDFSVPTYFLLYHYYFTVGHVTDNLHLELLDNSPCDFTTVEMYIQHPVTVPQMHHFQLPDVTAFNTFLPVDIYIPPSTVTTALSAEQLLRMKLYFPVAGSSVFSTIPISTTFSAAPIFIDAAVEIEYGRS